LAKIVIALAVNIAAIIAASAWISGFKVNGNFLDVIWVGVALTLLNLVLKPILKLFLGPLIVLTLGLGYILINVLLLRILDILFESLTIQGVLPLIYGALLFGLVNFIYHLATKE